MSNPLTVLKAEIEPSSLPHLLPLARVFEIDTDQFFKQIIDVTLRKLTASKEANDAVCSVTFADFKGFIVKMRNVSIAIDTCCIIAHEFSCGLDRIAAYKMAQLLAEKWVQTSARAGSEDVKKASEVMLSKLTVLIKLNITEHDLKKNHLGSLIENVPLPNNPEQFYYSLIIQIYNNYKQFLPKLKGLLMSLI
jgi:hypothetical protein